MKIKNLYKSMAIQSMQIRLAFIDCTCIYRFTKNLSNKAKYLNFVEISIVAFNVWNLNQVDTVSTVFL